MSQPKPVIAEVAIRNRLNGKVESQQRLRTAILGLNLPKPMAFILCQRRLVNGKRGLLRQLKEHLSSPLQSLVVPTIVASTCILVAILHPIATEAAKSTPLKVCSVQAGERSCELQGGAEGAGARLVMPFYAASLTIVAEVVVVIMSFLIIARGAGSMRAAAVRILNPSKLLMLLPVGVAYGFGDWLQMIAFNSASGPVVMVVGQSKLLLIAILSKIFIDGQRKTSWLRLAYITCGAIASTHICSAQPLAAAASAELYGASVAFFKAGLSSAGAVLTEKYYKTECDGFWVVSCRVQLMMFVSSTALLPWTVGSVSMADFFLAGPHKLCSECLEEDGTCECLDHYGWDSRTLLALLAVAINGLATGLTLRNLSAVSKAVCNALSAAIFYIIYVYMGFRPFNLALAMMILIVCMSSYEYAIEKLQGSSLERLKEADAACCMEFRGAIQGSRPKATSSPAGHMKDHNRVQVGEVVERRDVEKGCRGSLC